MIRLGKFRKPFSRLSIQGKLVVINITVTTLALTFAVVAAIYSEYSVSRTRIIDSLLVQAKMVSNNSAAAIVFDDPHAANDILQAFTESNDVLMAVILRPDDTVLASFVRISDENRADER